MLSSELITSCPSLECINNNDIPRSMHICYFIIEHLRVRIFTYRPNNNKESSHVAGYINKRLQSHYEWTFF